MTLAKQITFARDDVTFRGATMPLHYIDARIFEVLQSAAPDDVRLKVRDIAGLANLDEAVVFDHITGLSLMLRHIGLTIDGHQSPHDGFALVEFRPEPIPPKVEWKPDGPKPRIRRKKRDGV